MSQLFLRCLVTTSLTLTWQAGLHSQETETKSKSAWTAESVSEALKTRPRDPYLQFVDSLLSPVKQEANPTENRQRELRRLANRRTREVDLFSIFSGGLAIQESLQLDTLTGQTANVPQQKTTLKTSSLNGPQVKSHPWTKLLDGRNPQVSFLASQVPADQLFVRFKSVGKLLEMRQLADDYATYITTQSQQRSYSAKRTDAIQHQLALEVNDALQPVYEASIAEIAITSSDLYFAHGTDVTLLMQLNEEKFVRAQLDTMIDRAAKANPRAVAGTGEYLGIPFRYIESPDRRLSVYSAYPKPNLHVRSNSRVALERVLSVILKQPYLSKNLVPLSETDEFKYIRTLMPLDADEEDGIVYLSDPFIRNVVGPVQKLTQRSRLLCNSQLQLIAYASLLFETQFGRKASSIEELQTHGCLGTKEQPVELRCPDGGEFVLHDDGSRSVCSHHGCLHSLNPGCEIPRRTVTQEEATEYQEFVENYNRFWTTFFDPIVIRIQHSSKRVRVETIVLPLINNSIYRGLASTLGGETEALDQLPVARSNIFSIGTRLDKQRLLTRFAIPRPHDATVEPADDVPQDAQAHLEDAVRNLRILSLALHNYESAYKHFPPREVGGAGSQASQLSWRVQILPFLANGSQLYHQFHHDEPWDSPHNRELISKMPEEFAGASATLNEQGKTQFVRPFHETAAHYSKMRGTRFGAITDGTSNTIMAVVADEEHAVVWTKPDDIAIDMTRPRAGWSSGINGTVPVAKMDGAVVALPGSATDQQVRALLTRSGGEIIDIQLPPLAGRARPPRTLLSHLEGYEELGLPEFLYHGMGNQVGVHVGDTDPLIDFNVARFLGMMGGSFGGRDPMMFGETGVFALLALSMNAPVYISVPLENTDVTDSFLERLDQFLVRFSVENSQSTTPFFDVAQETYTFVDPDQTGSSVRAYAFRVGPLTWRFYWARIGDGLFIASKSHLIGELREATDSYVSEAGQEMRSSHGMIRVRPENWKQVKAHYAVGWAESERRACLGNLGPLADVARAQFGALSHAWHDEEDQPRLTNHVQPFCPCGGEYSFDGNELSTRCSVHGTLKSPQQPVGSTKSRLFELTSSLRDVFLELSFLEDGLHAVVTIERN